MTPSSVRQPMFPPSRKSPLSAQKSCRFPRGALELSYHHETEKIAEGTSGRIFLDSPETAASSFPQRGTVNAVHENKKFNIVIIVLIGWATEWAAHEALESPDRP